MRQLCCESDDCTVCCPAEASCTQKGLQHNHLNEKSDFWLWNNRLWGQKSTPPNSNRGDCMYEGFVLSFSVGKKHFVTQSSVWGPNTTSTWINISRPGWFSWIKTNYLMWCLLSFESTKPNLEYRCLRQSVSTANCTVKVLQKAPATHPLDGSNKHQAWTQMSGRVFTPLFLWGWPPAGASGGH